MGHASTEPERKSRKKHSSKSSKPRSSSKKPHVSQSVTDLYDQNNAPPVQAVPTQYLQSFQPPRPAMSPPPQATYSISPPQHPVYGRLPQHPPAYGIPYGSPPALGQLYASQPIRFASPPLTKRREDSPFQEQWDRLDRVAAKSYADIRNAACKSTTKLTSNYIERPTAAVAMKSMQALCHGAALYDVIGNKFDAVINSIDGERFSGKEQDLLIYENGQQASPDSSPPPNGPRKEVPNVARQMVGKDKGSNHFSKVWLYSNSRLPPHLPPFKVYMPTYPLLCLAATYSERVYTPPRSKSKETETHIPSDWRTGTKAMVLKSIPVDDMNTVVFAVRGSEGFMDWAVNYNTAPSSPPGLPRRSFKLVPCWLPLRGEENDQAGRRTSARVVGRKSSPIELQPANHRAFCRRCRSRAPLCAHDEHKDRVRAQLPHRLLQARSLHHIWCPTYQSSGSAKARRQEAQEEPVLRFR
jgi:hypothetical protein